MPTPFWPALPKARTFGAVWLSPSTLWCHPCAIISVLSPLHRQHWLLLLCPALGCFTPMAQRNTEVLSVQSICVTCAIYLCYLSVLTVLAVLYMLSICVIYVTYVIHLCYLRYLSVLSVLFVFVICLLYLCHPFPSWLPEQSLACCVQRCFKRAERKKNRLNVSAAFFGTLVRGCRHRGCGACPACAGVGGSELSLSALMCCGQPRSAPRSREGSCGRRQSPQIEDPVSHSWLP